MLAADIAAAILDATVAIAGNVENGTDGIIPGIGRHRAGRGFEAAGGDAHRLGFAFVAAGGVDRNTFGIEFPIATQSARAVGRGFNRDIASVNDLTGLDLFLHEQQTASPRYQRSEDRHR